MKMKLQEVQDRSNEMLREVVRICEKESIPYYMFYGSLLGTVRHKGMIPWDSDIDIAVPSDCYDRFSEAMERELDEKFWWDYRSERSYPRCFGRVGAVGFDTYYLHVDVYRLIGYSGREHADRRMSEWGHKLIRMRLVKTVNPLEYRGKKRLLVRLLKVLLFPIPLKAIIRAYDRLCRRCPYEKAQIVGTQDGPAWLIEKAWLEPAQKADYEDFSVRIPRDWDKVLKRWYGDYSTPPSGADPELAGKKSVEIREW